MSEFKLEKFSLCDDSTSNIIEFETSCEPVMTNKNSGKLHNQGCNITWDRCYRLAAHFLGLLCALLLAAIIMLYVKNKSLHIDCNDMTDDKTEYALVTGIGQHQVRFNNLSLEKEQLENSTHKIQGSYSSVVEERDLLQNITANITKEKIQLETLISDLVKEKDKLQILNNNLVKEKYESESRFKDMADQRDKIQNWYNDTAEEKNQLQTLADNLVEERNLLRTITTNISTEKSQLQTLISNLVKEKDKIQILNNNLAREKDESETRYKALADQRDEIQIWYNNTTEKKNQLQTLTSNLVEEKDHLLDQNDKLTKERDKLQLEKGELQKALSNFGWKYFKSSVYSTSTVKMNWAASRQHCRKNGADLVVINSEEEMIFVHGLLSELGAWLGLTDAENEGVWKWVDGTKLTTSYWMKGQPNNGGGNGNNDCGVIVFGEAVLQSWNDSPCNYISFVICEKSVA